MTGISGDWLSVEAVTVVGAANDTRLVRADVNGLVSTSSWKSMWTEAVVDGLRDNARRGGNFSAPGGGGSEENDAFALAAGRLLPVLEAGRGGPPLLLGVEARWRRCDGAEPLIAAVRVDGALMRCGEALPPALAAHIGGLPATDVRALPRNARRCLLYTSPSPRD